MAAGLWLLASGSLNPKASLRAQTRNLPNTVELPVASSQQQLNN